MPSSSGGQAGIEKIELGGLDEPLVEVIEMGTEQEDDVTRFEDRDPGCGGVVCNLTVGGQRRQVEQLPGARGAHPDKTLKCRKVAHIDELATVPFDISVYRPSKIFRLRLTAQRSPHMVQVSWSMGWEEAR